MGEELQLVRTTDIETLRLGALLHDIGKIGVPDEVLRKPGALTAAEFEVIKTHPVDRRAHPAQHSVPRAAYPDRRAASRASRWPRLSVRTARRCNSARRAHRARRRRVRRDDQRARLPTGAPAARSDRRTAALHRDRFRRRRRFRRLSSALPLVPIADLTPGFAAVSLQPGVDSICLLSAAASSSSPPSRSSVRRRSRVRATTAGDGRCRHGGGRRARLDAAP